MSTAISNLQTAIADLQTADSGFTTALSQKLPSTTKHADFTDRNDAGSHTMAAITGLVDALNAKLSNLTKHADFTDRNDPDSHTMGAITGLTAALNAKLDSTTKHNDLGNRNAADAHTIAAITGLTEALAALLPSTTSHNDLGGRTAADAHTIAAITGLQTALDDLNTAIGNKMAGSTQHNDLTGRNAVDAHSIGAITNLQNALDGKAASSHSHTKADIGLGNVDNVQQIPSTEKGQTNGVATLGTDGRIPSTQAHAKNREYTFVLHKDENVTVGVNKSNELIVTRPLTITKAYARAKIAPTGADILLDINVNGNSIWSTQSNRLKITAGTQNATQTTFDTASLVEGDILSIDIDQIGSITPGATLTVVLACS